MPVQDHAPPLNTFPVFHARILVGGDDQSFTNQAHSSLKAAGFRVESADDLDHLEAIWQTGKQEIVLLAILNGQSLSHARAVARRLSGHHTRPFIGYLADTSLHGTHLDDAAVFPMTAEVLPQALRQFFGPQMR